MEAITKESIEKAIERIDLNPEIKKGRNSTSFNLVYDNKTYPPILVLSEANKILGGNEITLDNDFNGSTKMPFEILRGLGFQIMEKENSFFDELKKFLEQAKSNDLKTKHYRKTFKDLQVKISFGSGNFAEIPWIAFLGYDQKVQEGIYPVYLLYKKQNLLILAYGVSQTYSANSDWQIDKKETINFFFEEGGLSKPKHYGNSYVFTAYDLRNPLDPLEINRDLEHIISQFKSQFEDNKSKVTKGPGMLFKIEDFASQVQHAGLQFDKTVIVRFVASLITKPFIILTGLSGSGKTKLAQAFVKWICASEDQFLIVPVGADWTNRDPLLGYTNALDEKGYVKPENRSLDLLIRAEANSSLPYFLILDEMNLSHVERYFADFLSAMESGGYIHLHSEDNRELNGVKSKIRMPKNIFIIGTVNVDETTNMFSPKVLDRANTIEFRIGFEDMAAFLQNPVSIQLEKLEGKGKNSAESFVHLAQSNNGVTSDLNSVKEILLGFFGRLRSASAEFGYRGANEIIRLITNLTLLKSDLTINEKIDIAVVQKLLPKLHGSRRKLCPILITLAKLCIEDTVSIEKDVFDKEDFDFYSSSVKFPLTLEKLSRMYRAAIDNGFSSFAEA